MVLNKFIACNTCEENINLRIQMGSYAISHIINCPRCETRISVEVTFEPFHLQLRNAHELEKQPDFPLWCTELSSELIVRKVFLRKSVEDATTPFISNLSRYDSTTGMHYINEYKQAIRFAENIEKGKIVHLLRVYELLWNDKLDYLIPETRALLVEIKDLTPIKDVESILDAVIVLHQYLILTGISIVTKKDDLTEYNRLGRIILSPNNRRVTLEYINKYKDEITCIEKRGICLIDKFSKVYSQLIPIINSVNTEKYSEIDQNLYGISTASYDDLKSIYAESYEWILDSLNTVIALNNISVRRNYRVCIADKDFDNDLMGIGSKYKKKKFYLSPDEPFSKPLETLNNNIRNAIQHYDDEINYMSQIILFKDRNKGKINEVSISLMDFGKLCLENISWILYILELIYNLRKLFYINEGIVLSAYDEHTYSKSLRGQVKVGRNELCPCGSGKKYKKCCGR